VALRRRIVLAAAAGQSDSAIAQQLEINRKTVDLWRTRFSEQGLETLWEVAPGRGRKPIYGPERSHAILDATLQTNWPNLVGRWLAELTSERARHGSFVSVEDLENAVQEFLPAWNENPKPFVWMATVASIQEKLSRCRQTLEQIQPGCTQPRSRRGKKTLSS